MIKPEPQQPESTQLTPSGSGLTCNKRPASDAVGQHIPYSPFHEIPSSNSGLDLPEPLKPTPAPIQRVSSKPHKAKFVAATMDPLPTASTAQVGQVIESNPHPVDRFPLKVSEFQTSTNPAPTSPSDQKNLQFAKSSDYPLNHQQFRPPFPNLQHQLPSGQPRITGSQANNLRAFLRAQSTSVSEDPTAALLAATLSGKVGLAESNNPHLAHWRKLSWDMGLEELAKAQYTGSVPLTNPSNSSLVTGSTLGNGVNQLSNVPIQATVSQASGFYGYIGSAGDLSLGLNRNPTSSTNFSSGSSALIAHPGMSAQIRSSVPPVSNSSLIPNTAPKMANQNANFVPIQMLNQMIGGSLTNIDVLMALQAKGQALGNSQQPSILLEPKTNVLKDKNDTGAVDSSRLTPPKLRLNHNSGPEGILNPAPAKALNRNGVPSIITSPSSTNKSGKQPLEAGLNIPPTTTSTRALSSGPSGGHTGRHFSPPSHSNPNPLLRSHSQSQSRRDKAISGELGPPISKAINSNKNRVSLQLEPSGHQERLSRGSGISPKVMDPKDSVQELGDPSLPPLPSDSEASEEPRGENNATYLCESSDSNAENSNGLLLMKEQYGKKHEESHSVEDEEEAANELECDMESTADLTPRKSTNKRSKKADRGENKREGQGDGEEDDRSSTSSEHSNRLLNLSLFSGILKRIMRKSSSDDAERDREERAHEGDADEESLTLNMSSLAVENPDFIGDSPDHEPSTSNSQYLGASYSGVSHSRSGSHTPQTSMAMGSGTNTPNSASMRLALSANLASGGKNKLGSLGLNRSYASPPPNARYPGQFQLQSDRGSVKQRLALGETQDEARERDKDANNEEQDARTGSEILGTEDFEHGEKLQTVHEEANENDGQDRGQMIVLNLDVRSGDAHFIIDPVDRARADECDVLTEGRDVAIPIQAPLTRRGDLPYRMLNEQSRQNGRSSDSGGNRTRGGLGDAALDNRSLDRQGRGHDGEDVPDLMSSTSVTQLKSEKSLSIAAQVVLPFLIAGFGMVAAGMVLAIVRKWQVFQTYHDLDTIVPPLLGLKGNLEMTLASRLSTQANLGHMDDRTRLFRMIAGNMALVEAQALILSCLASIVAVVFGYFSHGVETSLLQTLKTALLLAASATSTAAIAALFLGLIMVTVIVVSRRLRINPDNIATPVAASLGDLTATALLAFFANFYYESILLQGHWWVLLAVVLVSVLLAPFLILVARRNPYTRQVVYDGWIPIVSAVCISNVAGWIYSKAGEMTEMTPFVPVMNGVGGNLAAIQASRLSTTLHTVHHRPGFILGRRSRNRTRKANNARVLQDTVRDGSQNRDKDGHSPVKAQSKYKDSPRLSKNALHLALQRGPTNEYGLEMPENQKNENAFGNDIGSGIGIVNGNGNGGLEASASNVSLIHLQSQASNFDSTKGGLGSGSALNSDIENVGGELRPTDRASDTGRELHRETSTHDDGIIIPSHECCFPNPIRAFFDWQRQHARTARVLLALALPGHVIFALAVIFTRILTGQESSLLCVQFFVLYLSAVLIQVMLLLYITLWLVGFLWKCGNDPDNFAIPYLTALGDVFGTGLLFGVFFLLEKIFSVGNL